MRNRFFASDEELDKIKRKIIEKCIKQTYDGVEATKKDVIAEAKSRGLSKKEALEIFEETKALIPSKVEKECLEAFRQLEKRQGP
jgi:hypothetical protein